MEHLRLQRWLCLVLLVVCCVALLGPAEGAKTVQEQIRELDQRVDELCQQEKYAEALFPARVQVELYKRQGKNKEEGRYYVALTKLATIYLCLGDLARLETVLEESADIVKRVLGAESEQYVQELLHLADIHNALGHFNKEIAVQQQLVRLLKKKGDTDPQYLLVLEQLASTYLDALRFSEAEKVWDEYLAIRKRTVGENHPEYARALINHAVLSLKKGDFPAAHEILTQATAILQQAGAEKHPYYAMALEGMALYHELTGRTMEAIAIREQLLQIKQVTPGKDTQEYANALSNLAQLYAQISRHADAESNLLQARGIYENAVGKHHLGYINLLCTHATCYVLASQLLKAEDTLKTALLLAQETAGVQSVSYEQVVGRLASCQVTLGKFGEAEVLYTESVSRKEKVYGKKHPETMSTLAQLADLYQRAGRYVDAETCLQRALDGYESSLGKQSLEYARVQYKLGGLYFTLGQYTRAEPLYLSFLATWKELLGESTFEYLLGLDGVAGLYSAMCKYDKAESLLLQKIDILKRNPDANPFEYFRTLDSLLQLYIVSAQLKQGEKVIEELKRFIVQHPHPEDKTLACSLYFTLGLGCLATGDGENAVPYFQSRQEGLKELFGDTNPFYINSVISLGQIRQYYLGDYLQVETDYLHGLHWYRQRQTTSFEHGVLLADLAALYQATERRQDAVATMQASMSMGQQSLTDVLAISAEADMYEYTAKFDYQLYRYLSLAMANVREDNTVTQSVFDWVLRRKALVFELNAAFNRIRKTAAANPAVSTVLAEYRRTREYIDTLNASPLSNQNATWEASLNQAQSRSRELEGQLNKVLSHAISFETIAKVDTAAVRQRLPKNSALIEIVRMVPFRFTGRATTGLWSPPRYVAFVLTAETTQPVALVDLGEAETIDATIRQYREVIARSGRILMRTAEKHRREQEQACLEEYQEIAQILYRAVFAPLRKACGSATRLYIAPDGELNLIPYQALVDDDGKFLVEAYRIAYLTCGRDLLRIDAQPASRTVVFAAPDFGITSSERHTVASQVSRHTALQRGVAPAQTPLGDSVRGLRWDYLNGTMGEANEIKKSLAKSAYAPVECYTGKTALEDLLKSMPTPRILHIATHGFYLPAQKLSPDQLSFLSQPGKGLGVTQNLTRLGRMENPMLRSGIVLAGANTIDETVLGYSGVDDGWVTAAEIAELDLRGTQLVVLSACETGVGDIKSGEGVFGLRRAFLTAGAETVVSSLFEVPDTQTQKMMSVFYQRLQQGAKIPDAFHHAQLMQLRDRKTGSIVHPYYWASFILVGRQD